MTSPIRFNDIHILRIDHRWRVEEIIGGNLAHHGKEVHRPFLSQCDALTFCLELGNKQLEEYVSKLQQETLEQHHRLNPERMGR